MSEPASVRDNAKRNAMIEALNHVLGNGCRLLRTSKCAEWNIHGQGAAEAASVFRSQAAEIFQGQDQIASRIWFLRGVAVPDDEDDVVVLRPQDQSYLPSDTQSLVSMMMGGHENAVLSLKAAFDVAEDIGNVATATILAQRVLAHEDHIGVLRRLVLS